MNRSLTVAAVLVAALLGSGATLAARAADAPAAKAPGKASCCADKGAHHHDCGGKDGCCCDHEGKDGCPGAHKGMMDPAMAAKMGEMDKRMDELAAKMNSAKGDDKVDAMAAVLNEMLARQKAMREHMHARHEAMCGGADGKAEEKEKSEGLLGEQEKDR